jgi:hypothetical protein
MYPTSKTLSRILLLSGLCISVAQAMPDVQAPSYSQPSPAPRLAPQPVRDFAAQQARLREPGPSGEQTLERMQRVRGISANALDKGRALYKNLLLALNAARRHDQLDLRLGLNNADNIVQGLYRPARVRALMRQSDIIRENLRHGGKHIGKGLWLPLQAELDTIRVTLPVERYREAKAALARGAEAAGKGDKAGANAALDDVERSLVQQYVLLPLAEIRGDLRAADNALDPEPPYWQGVGEALQSALDSIRWVTTAHADNWMSAYMSAVEAVQTFPYRPRVAHRWLQVTAQRLQGIPGGKDLASRAQTLAQGPRPSFDDLYNLSDNIAAHISEIGNP